MAKSIKLTAKSNEAKPLKQSLKQSLKVEFWKAVTKDSHHQMAVFLWAFVKIVILKSAVRKPCFDQSFD